MQFYQLNQQDRLKTEQAWEIIVEKIRRLGSYGDPSFDASVEQALKPLGGFYRLCKLSEHDLNQQKELFFKCHAKVLKMGSPLLNAS